MLLPVRYRSSIVVHHASVPPLTWWFGIIRQIREDLFWNHMIRNFLRTTGSMIYSRIWEIEIDLPRRQKYLTHSDQDVTSMWGKPPLKWTAVSDWVLYHVVQFYCMLYIVPFQNNCISEFLVSSVRGDVLFPLSERYVQVYVMAGPFSAPEDIRPNKTTNTFYERLTFIHNFCKE